MLVDPILTFQETLVGSYGVSITILTVTLLLGVVVVVVLVVVVVIGVVVDVVVVGGNSVVVDVVVVVIGVVVDAVVVVVVVGGNSVVVVVTVDADKYKVSICIQVQPASKDSSHKLTCTCSTGRSCRWRWIDCYTLEY